MARVGNIRHRLPGLLLACVFCVTAGAVDPGGEEGVAEFLTAVEGPWQGRAVTTPAGPFPYDMDFVPDEAACRSGVARPGGFSHRWTFCPVADGLNLEFLSDFGGNDRPVSLALETVDGGTLVFLSQTLDFLKVLARLEQDCLRLQVLHHDRLHVEVHLRRATAPEGECPWPPPGQESS